MLGGAYELTFDVASVRRIAALVNTAPIFAFYYEAAMRMSVNLVVRYAIRNAPVLSGDLWRAIRSQVVTPYLGKVGVLSAVPYARRREFGFDDKTDVLERHYTLDPKDAGKRSHMMYLHRAYKEAQPAISAAWRSATQLAIRRAIA